MSTPRINPNDPKWTAYVLGELDEAECAAVERLLDTSDEARALVDDLKLTAVALEEAYDTDRPVLLTAAQRAAVRVAAGARPAWWSASSARWVVAGSVAAAIVLVSVALMERAPQRFTGGPVPAAADAIAGPLVVASNPVSSPAASLPSETPQSAVPAVPPQLAATESQPAATHVLSGAVRDASGGALPGVAVTAVDLRNQTTRTAVTDQFGRYALTVEPGTTQRVTASLPGFEMASADLNLDTPGAARRDFTMAVGALAETVTVRSSSPRIDAQTARLADVQARGRVVGGVVPAPGAGPSPPPAAVRLGFTTGFASSIPSIPLNTESYARVAESGFVRVTEEPLATFSIDVDTASYSNVRRFLTQDQLPPADAVRIEELVNYFTYDYTRPSGSHPIAASMEVASAPWNPQHRVVRIGLKAREIALDRRPPSNLVFLIDVSGSMATPQKLPLVKSGLKLLLDQLGANDMVSMVVYAGTSGLVLPATSGERKDVIGRAIDNLEAGGSTNGGSGIQLAYNQAAAHFVRGGVNRVILMTDGDFNVGVTNQADLTALIEERARSGVFLSVLGFGMGNLKDSMMERLADQGNGHYAYIDTLNEARKVLVEEMTGTLITVAKDVKVQVDFNPAKVQAYRLIGYDNRALRPEDFNNDLKDAGDMGAGHTVTALFEVVPNGVNVPGPSVDPSMFRTPATARAASAPASTSNNLLMLRLRYKLPDAADSTRLDVPLADRETAFANATTDFRFAGSVAAFGMVLKTSPYRGSATLAWVLDAATASTGSDHGGYRSEFIALVQKAIALRGSR